MSQLAPGAQTVLDARAEQLYDPGNEERYSHYVPKAKLTEALVNGTPVVALCGKVWVPHRDPQKYPVCPDCKEIYESFSPGEGDGEGE